MLPARISLFFAEARTRLVPQGVGRSWSFANGCGSSKPETAEVVPARLSLRSGPSLPGGVPRERLLFAGGIEGPFGKGHAMGPIANGLLPRWFRREGRSVPARHQSRADANDHWTNGRSRGQPDLACAVAARVDLHVSGDRHHLLPLERHQGARILTLAALLAEVAAEPTND